MQKNKDLCQMEKDSEEEKKKDSVKKKNVIEDNINSDQINNKFCECEKNKDKTSDCSDINSDALKDIQKQDIDNNNTCQVNEHSCNKSINKEKLEDTIKELEKNNSQLQTNLMEISKNLIHDRLKYAADLENFKKRIQKEKELEQKYASLDLIKDILVPYEQLEKVMEMNTDDDKLKNFLLGFKMIYQQMKKVLEKNGVQEILTLGQKFNPEQHYAVEKISDKNKPNNTIISVLQKGFQYKEMIIKPAMVKINEWSEEYEKKNK